MKKILFNDKYGLTDAVLNGAKTMTRRIIPQKILDKCVVSGEAMLHAPFQVGEIVAIAQSYSDVLEEMITKKDGFGKEESDFQDEWYGTPGWNNKMFVGSNRMLHHVRITDMRVERLKEITEEDCLREGVLKSDKYAMPYGIPDLKAPNGVFFYYSTPKEAFAALIDKVGKRGTWDSNPWVYVYEFELVD